MSQSLKRATRQNPEKSNPPRADIKDALSPVRRITMLQTALSGDGERKSFRASNEQRDQGCRSHGAECHREN